MCWCTLLFLHPASCPSIFRSGSLSLLASQAADFPGVDFSLMQHSTDEMWEALHAATCQDGGCYLSGEEERHCEQRALDFYAWLLDRCAGWVDGWCWRCQALLPAGRGGSALRPRFLLS